MSNGEVCCILGVCCPPGSAAQHEALVHMIQKAKPALDDAAASKVADRVLAQHDMFRSVAALVNE